LSSRSLRYMRSRDRKRAVALKGFSAAVVWTSAPSPPSPTLTKSARGCTRSQCAVWLYAVRGIRCTDRIRTASCCPRTTRSALPRRRVVLTSRDANYLLVLFRQLGQPIGFLYARVELAKRLGKIVSLPLCGSDAHRTDELHLRTGHAALRSRSGGREFPVRGIA